MPAPCCQRCCQFHRRTSSHSAEPCNVVSHVFREPDRVVWSYGDSPEVGCGGWHQKLFHHPLGRYAQNVRPGLFGCPQVAISACCNDVGLCTLSLIHISEPTRRTPISYA